MKTFKLPRLISDGMVLQQKKRVRIWGEDEPGRKVTVSFLQEEYGSDTDEIAFIIIPLLSAMASAWAVRLVENISAV